MAPEKIAEVLLKRHEGFSSKVYLDTKGIPTVGYGRNLKSRGITKEEAEYLLRNDIALAVKYLQRILPGLLETLSPVRQAVLIDMMVNMGPTAFSGFVKMMNNLRLRDYNAVAREMENSKWAKDVGRRAKTLTEIMRTGELPNEIKSLLKE